MKTSKITVIGLLICLTSIFFTNELWGGLAVLEVLPVLGLVGFPIGFIVTLIGLFFDSGEDSDNESDNIAEDGNHISQIACPNCEKKHDIDYPKCPYCKYQY